MITHTANVPERDAPRWLALGYTIRHEAHPVGARGEGPHVTVEWCGEGPVPIPCPKGGTRRPDGRCYLGADVACPCMYGKLRADWKPGPDRPLT